MEQEKFIKSVDLCKDLFLSSIPASVPDSILNDLANVSSHALVSVGYEPLDAFLGMETAAARVKENTSTREIPIRDTVADQKKPPYAGAGGMGKPLP